jgi:hypothetical protein
VVDKNKHTKMTDHVAEQIEMKFKAATVPQPPTKPVCQYVLYPPSRLLSQSEMVLNQVDADGRYVLSLRTFAWVHLEAYIPCFRGPEGGNVLAT